jgi:class 3 adenylate cyclase
MPGLRCGSCAFENPIAAHFCQQCGAPLTISDLDSLHQDEITPHNIPAQPVSGERKPVAIFFSDIVGSTSIAEKLDPEEWREIISGAHRIVGEAVRQFDGTVAQFLGDGVLAFFGARQAHEDDAQRAVLAAMEIQNRLQDYRRELSGMLDDFQMRIGIHTGMVVVGQVGDEEHAEYLAVGDAVNLASRLQSAARPGRVLVSETIERLLRGAFDLEDLGQIAVKGRTEPVHVFEILCQTEKPALERGVPGLV